MAQIQSPDSSDAGEAVEQQERSLVAGGHAKWCSRWGRELGGFRVNMLSSSNQAITLLGIHAKELKGHIHTKT